ncbi:MAG: FAD-dependent oxidoreductase [Phormidesmis sp.]
MNSQRISVCQTDELRDGEMRQFSVADKEILVAKSEGKFWAIAAHCSHYGAPLVDGVLQGDRVVCPWHNACFSVQSGVQLEPPGCDDLAQYAVEVDSGALYVKLPLPESEQLTPDLGQQDSQQDQRTFVIVGGGAAGSSAAQMLRQVDFKGRIVLLTDESKLPYDRTKLSKAYLQSDSDPSDEDKSADLLRSTDFYKRYDIEVKTRATVTKLDVQSQQITYGDNQTIRYDSLLIATGGKVKKMPMDGADKGNVFTLRNAQDARAILKAAESAQRAVVVGTGFIGMEVAASLRQQGLEVTVVSPNKVPFQKVLGDSVGKLFQQVHESHGVRFKLNCKATAFKGESTVEAVELDNGETLSADMVVVGIGVEPATDFIEGLKLNEDDKSISVDKYLRAAPGVYAAGDISQFPHFLTGDPVRIEHWRLAMQQGRTAACNMAGQEVPFGAVPFFWTGQFDLKLRYVGHAEDYDDVIVQGSLADKSFLAFYVKAQQVLAVSGIGQDRAIAAISELMRLGKMPAADALKQTDINWVEQLED